MANPTGINQYTKGGKSSKWGGGLANLHVKSKVLEATRKLVSTHNAPVSAGKRAEKSFSKLYRKTVTRSTNPKIVKLRNS